MQGFFIDIQGTLIDDKNHLPLPGSIEFLDYLNSKNIPYILITNNTKRDSVEFQNYLKNLGFKFDNYLDPLMVLDEYVKNKKIAPFGGDKFLELMQKYEIDYKNPESVVLGLKLFSNDEIAEIIELLLKGCELIGMHKTSLYHKNNKRYPGLGALIEKVIPVCPWESKWPIEFAEKGFKVMVSPWKNPRAAEGLVNATDQIKKSQFEGILYTTWSADVVPDLKDALLGNDTKRKLDPTIIGVAKSMKRTIDAGALND